MMKGFIYIQGPWSRIREKKKNLQNLTLKISITTNAVAKKLYGHNILVKK